MRRTVTSIGSKEDPCFACRSGFPDECHNAWHDEEPCGEVKFTATGEVKVDNQSDEDSGLREVDSGYIQDGYTSAKDLSDYKDPISTGRKRAAEMYPIGAGMVCEWARLKKAGGGVIPIVGCVGRPASDRHHGPDKNTMNNAPGNLHRICDHCHNTWHALNDPHYGDRPSHTTPFIPKGEKGIDWFEHDSDTQAEMSEILDAEAKRLAER
jgi:hypothetical protein